MVAVVADSTAILPRDLIQEYSISLVPMTIAFGEEVYRDMVDLEPGRFYELLVASRVQPTTAQPSPAQFLEVFGERAESADGVACLVFSRALSGTYHSAAVAREMFLKERPGYPLEVVDTGTVAGAHGLAVLEAARLAREGAPLERVTSVAREIGAGAKLYAVLDTLEYLARGGRIGKAASLLGSMLNIKPILSIADGTVYAAGRALSRERALARILEMVERDVGPGGSGLHATVMHAMAPQDAGRLAAAFQKRFRPAELILTEFSPVMGVHTGPGLVGIGYYLRKEV